MDWLLSWHWTTLITGMSFLVQLCLLPLLLLHKKKHPESTVAWLMLLLMVPIFGGVVFVIFGINRVERKAARRALASRAITRNLPELTQYQLIPSEKYSVHQRRLMRLATRLAETVPTNNNKVEIVADTNRTFGLIEQAIREAKQSIHLEYYIWQPDATGLRLRDWLVERARSGVEVRVLVDGIGSWAMRRNRRFVQPMKDAGIQFATFLSGQHWRNRLLINLRSHRKIVVVDGQTGFTGGMNIGDEYLGLDPKLGYWRDTHMRIQGPAVLQLQQVFAEDWYHATGEELTAPSYYPPPIEGGPTAAQVLAGEPSGEAEVFHQLMFTAINEAERRLTLATSYFVPTPALAMALESAAYRGVKVRLLLCCQSAHMATVYAAQSYYDSLLQAGVEIYEYQKGLLHSKTMTIDGHWSFVGSPNFDSRSLLLNFEIGLAFYDSRVAQQLEEDFENDQKDARQLEYDEWVKRPKWRVLRENICRLFSPVL
ncbi:cardiolipin synthase [Thalassoroseus pseudoceratinae]|uniref:cardiolipin synthase n=1 Tax=Thalassoroseus pseudoceratinae TaxID=2713176 RepID=UPI0014247443|nr:cardiolipin synthase [Thalassoroseus pseudoceratinae]